MSCQSATGPRGWNQSMTHAPLKAHVELILLLSDLAAWLYWLSAWLKSIDLFKFNTAEDKLQ